MEEIFNSEDLMGEIAKHLDVKSKVNMYSAFGMNLFYNKNLLKDLSKNTDILYFDNDDMTSDDEDFMIEYYGDLCSNFSSEMSCYYEEYSGEYSLMYNCSIIQELTEFFHSTINFVYNRALIEYIERNEIKCEKFIDKHICEIDYELSENGIDIYDDVIKYYHQCFEDDITDVFCRKCGEFGHDYYDKEECIFYNEKYSKKMIKNDMTKIAKEIVVNVLDIIKKKEIQKELCHLCKDKYKAKKCKNFLCGSCCDCENHCSKKIKSKYNKTKHNSKTKNK